MHDLSENMKNEIRDIANCGIDTICNIEKGGKDLVNEFMGKCLAELYQFREEIDDYDIESAAIQLGTMYKNISVKHNEIKTKIISFSSLSRDVAKRPHEIMKFEEEDIQRIHVLKMVFERTIELIIQKILGTDDIKLLQLIVIKDIIAGMINGYSAYINFDTE